LLPYDRRKQHDLRKKFEIKKDDIEVDLQIIDGNLRQLVKLYEDFFAHKIYKEPKELRTQTEFLIQKWKSKIIPRTLHRFKFENLAQRYSIFKEKWDRQMRIREKEEREF
jgi:hypothetical protein